MAGDRDVRAGARSRLPDCPCAGSPAQVHLLGFSLHVHGDADPIADYVTTRGRVEEWAAERGCALETFSTPLADEVVREEFQTCAADLAIVTIRGGGHQRPGDPAQLDVERFGPQSDQVSTVTLAWQWFRAHALNRDAGEG